MSVGSGGEGRPEPILPDTDPIEQSEKVGRIDREVLYDGRVVHLSLDSVRFPGGRRGTLELVSHPGAAAVLPFLDPPTSPDPRIVLVHQYRYAAGGVLWEVPAGVPDSSSESWVDCARRELKEETGFAAGDLRYLTRILTTPGFTDEVIQLFVASDLTIGTTDRDEDEFLEVVEMPFSRALDGVREGRIVDGKSVAILLFASSFLGEVWPERRPPPRR